MQLLHSLVDPRLDIAALNEPGRQVSGDYYDVLKMNSGRIGVVIADVTGKGVAAALIAANLQAAIRVLMPNSTDLAALAVELNRLLYGNTDTSRFVTVILAAIDPENRVLEFVSAGHHSPIRIGAEQQVELGAERGGLPFGVEEDADYECVRIELGSEASTLFLYTDGLNEALNEEEEEYGAERIFETLGQHADAKPEELLKVIRQSVTDFCGNVPQSDDITLLAIHTG